MSSNAGIIPPALGNKGTIALVSPSARVNKIFPTRISRATAWFNSQGYQVKEIFNPIPPSSTHLETIKHRCDELHRAFADPDVSAIICTIGGETANELLRHLDYALIRQHPKIFCGFSDITLLHHAFFTQAGLRTFYGPAIVPGFGEYPEPHPFTANSFFEMVSRPAGPVALGAHHEFTQEFLDWCSEESNQRARTYEPAPGWKWLRKGSAKGRIFGGCLASLKQIMKTEWFPDYKGKIMFFETSEGPGAPDAVFTVEMARLDLCDLRNAGILDGIAGLVVGRPLFYDAEMRARLEQMVIDQTDGLDIPILANVDIGHTSPGLTVPLNALSELNSESNSFNILEL